VIVDVIVDVVGDVIVDVVGDVIGDVTTTRTRGRARGQLEGRSSRVRTGTKQRWSRKSHAPLVGKREGRVRDGMGWDGMMGMGWDERTARTARGNASVRS